VCCPHAQYYWWGVHSGLLLGLEQGETLVTTLPLFHTNALNAFFQALLTGSTLVVEKRFSASVFWESLVQHQASVTYVLGAMVPILLAKEPSPLDRAHRVRIALAPGVPQQFQASFTQRFGMALLEGYGSTETNFVIGAEIAHQKPGTMGLVREGFEAKVVDDEDNELPAGVPGELIIRATEPFSMATGYFGMPEKTVEAWRNLWFHTGDRVIRDADGHFRFVDRLKDAIRRRGENISSYEVEQVLLSHPDIDLAAVFPVKSEMAEDEVMSALVLRAGATPRPDRADALLRNAPGLLCGAALRGRGAAAARHRERQGAEVQAARTRRHAHGLGPRSCRLQVEALSQSHPFHPTEGRR
jgi:crotonobetaine/carnitine-CoA ligase